VSEKYLVNSFAYGEISPELTGRIDAPYYRQACKTLLNMFPKASGPVTKRPGTFFCAKITAETAALIPFPLSETSGNIVCIYDDGSLASLACFFKVNNGLPEQIKSGGSVYTIAISYSIQKDFIRYIQDSVSAIHDTMFFINTLGAGVVLSLTRASETSWTYTANAIPDLSGGSYLIWGLEIYQDRLVVISNCYNNKVCISASNDHDEFTIPVSAVAESPIEFDLSPDKSPVIVWVFGEAPLLLGTPSGIYRVAGAEDPLDGTAITVGTLQCSTGCASVKPVMLDDALAFVQKSGKRVHTLQYDSDVEKYVSTDITFLAEHIVDGKIIQLAIQKEPVTILWAVTDSGQLLAMSYSRQMGTAGWSRMDVGGEVESVAIIPGTDEDHVFLIVKRTINGSEVRYVEMFAPHAWEEVEDCHFVDSGILWDGGEEKTVTSITAANPAVCTATSHGFTEGTLVRFKGVSGLTAVNGEVFTVHGATTHTFELYSPSGTAPADLSAFSEGSGGTVEKVTQVVTGLSHLEGEEVAILGDGSVFPSETVVSGSVTLDGYANKIHVGLPFTAEVEPLDIASGPGTKKLVRNVYAKFHKTSFVKIGKDEDTLRDVTLVEGAPTMDEAPDLTTAEIREFIEDSPEFETSVLFASDLPLPFTLISILTEMERGR